MHKQPVLVATLALLFVFVSHRGALAQSETPRFEVGAQFSTIRLGDFDPGNELIRQDFPNLVPPGRLIRVEPGIGGRFTYNLTARIALEAEATFFPRDKNPDINGVVGEPIKEPLFSGGRKTLYLFGPKVGVRTRKIGVFGKVRPGFVRFGRFPTIFFISRGSSSVALAETDDASAKFFALDIGGLTELYTSRRLVVRFDLGDTIIHYRKRSPPHDLNPNFTRHNLQFSVGFGFRF